MIPVQKPSGGIYLHRIALYVGLASGLATILLVGLLCGLVARPQNCKPNYNFSLPTAPSTKPPQTSQIISTRTNSPTQSTTRSSSSSIFSSSSSGPTQPSFISKNKKKLKFLSFKF